MKKQEGVWLVSLYRFGYELTVAEVTKEKAIDALMKEYCRAFEDINAEDPRAEHVNADEDEPTFYEVAREDIEIRFCAFGEVEWR